jgi:putative cardiolipin synthase
VDNAVSIVGGRNLADEYFQLKENSVFVNFEVLAVGSIAADISHSFDQYWNHSRALPIDQFIDEAHMKLAQDEISLLHRKMIKATDRSLPTYCQAKYGCS